MWHLQEVLRITQNTTEKIHELTCNHQEADTRTLLHAQHANLSYEEIFGSTPDTDVFFIMLSMMPDMNIKLYMLAGTGSKRRIIDMNAVGDDIFDKQNQTNSSKNDLLKALIGFHCFTGCDAIVRLQQELNWSHWSYFSPIVTMLAHFVHLEPNSI